MNERHQGSFGTGRDGFAAVAMPDQPAMPVVPVASADRSVRIVELVISFLAIAAALLVAAMR